MFVVSFILNLSHTFIINFILNLVLLLLVSLLLFLFRFIFDLLSKRTHRNQLGQKLLNLNLQRSRYFFNLNILQKLRYRYLQLNLQFIQHFSINLNLTSLNLRWRFIPSFIGHITPSQFNIFHLLLNLLFLPNQLQVNCRYLSNLLFLIN